MGTCIKDKNRLMQNKILIHRKLLSFQSKNGLMYYACFLEKEVYMHFFLFLLLITTEHLEDYTSKIIVKIRKVKQCNYFRPSSNLRSKEKNTKVIYLFLCVCFSLFIYQTLGAENVSNQECQ